MSYHYGFCPDCREVALKYDVLAADQSLSKGSFTDCVVLLTHATDRVSTPSEIRVLRMVLDQLTLEMKPVAVVAPDYVSVRRPTFFNRLRKMSGLFKADVLELVNDGYEVQEKLDLYDDCLILTERVIEINTTISGTENRGSRGSGKSISKWSMGSMGSMGSASRSNGSRSGGPTRALNAIDVPLQWSPSYSLSKLKKPVGKKDSKRRGTFYGIGGKGFMNLVRQMSGIHDVDDDDDDAGEN